AAGSRTASFTITTSAPSTEVDVGITARSGGASWNRPFYVRPLNRLSNLTSMTISPGAITGGNTSGGTLTFSGPIPLGTWPALTSLPMTVSTNRPEPFMSLPANVTVFTGSTTASFAFVTSKAVTASTPVSLSAAYGASAASLALTVNPPASATPPITSVTVSPATVNAGASSIGTATLQSAAPGAGAV